MSQRAKVIGVFSLVLAVVLAIATVGYVRSDSDGIEEGKNYGLAMTYKTTLKQGGAEARVFDFADRNLPRTSVLVPLRNGQGIELVKEDNSMPPSTVRKVRIRVPEAIVEGVKYPAYEYVQWQFRFAVKEPQTHVPSVIPRR